jgi:hypothetical protein
LSIPVIGTAENPPSLPLHHAHLLRMPALHGMLSLAWAGQTDRDGDSKDRRIPGCFRRIIHPDPHPHQYGKIGARIDGQAQWGMHLPGRRPVPHSTRQTTAMPRFPQPVELSRIREIMSIHSCRTGRSNLSKANQRGDRPRVGLNTKQSIILNRVEHVECTFGVRGVITALDTVRKLKPDSKTQR